MQNLNNQSEHRLATWLTSQKQRFPDILKLFCIAILKTWKQKKQLGDESDQIPGYHVYICHRRVIFDSVVFNFCSLVIIY